MMITRWWELKKKGVKIWGKCNVYRSAVIGRRVHIGFGSEIGDGVELGDDVTIGAMCYVPAGVKIKRGAWIGPRVTFTNDRYPPSPKENWERTTVEMGARLGAGVTVICGVNIGSHAIVGAGSVVTRDIPPEETWAGVPAKRLNGGK